MERECNAARGETPNDAFFTEQRDAFESGRAGSFLEGGKTATPFRIVCRAFVNHAREYVRGAVGEEAAPVLFRREHEGGGASHSPAGEAADVDMFVWAGTAPFF